VLHVASSRGRMCDDVITTFIGTCFATLQAFDSLTHILIVRDMLAWDTTSDSDSAATIAETLPNQQHAVSSTSVGLHTALTITVTVRSSNCSHLVRLNVHAQRKSCTLIALALVLRCETLRTSIAVTINSNSACTDHCEMQCTQTVITTHRNVCFV
jgi:hypothetical protein